MIWRCKKNYFFNISIFKDSGNIFYIFFVLLNSSLTTIILPFSIPSLISKDSINFCSGTCLFLPVNKYFLRQSYILNIFLNPYILINIPNCNNLYSRDQKIKQQYLLFYLYQNIIIYCLRTKITVNKKKKIKRKYK